MPKSPGLYLHVPFCSAICPYCDFAVTIGGVERRERFVASLIEELRRVAQAGPWAPFETVYLGGGTPSALSDRQLSQVLETARESLPTGIETGSVDGPGGSSRATVSIEANPEDVSKARVRAWAAMGIGRLSLGIQSFDGRELEFLGRRHSPVDARRAVEVGLDAGLLVSMDLIYGLPGQMPGHWQSQLEAAVALQPHHISCYQLTIEPGTAFARRSRRGDWAEPGNDALARLFLLTHEFLGSVGYPAYEVSNFARSTRYQCDHNRKYWECAPYLGLGPSAHSFDGRSRWWNLRSERDWRRELEAGRSPEAEREWLSDQQLALERLMLGLRTPAGVDLLSLGLDPGSFVAANSAVLERFAKQKLLRIREDRLIPTLRGMARADALARAIEIGTGEPEVS